MLLALAGSPNELLADVKVILVSHGNGFNVNSQVIWGVAEELQRLPTGGL